MPNQRQTCPFTALGVGNGRWEEGNRKKRRKWRGGQANGGVGGGGFQKRSWWPQLWEQWIEKEEFKTIFFLILWKLIKMAAAVAKAQEKNRVPESPQVLRLFLTQDTQRERTPMSLPIGTGLQPSWVWAVLDTDKTCWGWKGGWWQTENQTKIQNHF